MGHDDCSHGTIEAQPVLLRLYVAGMTARAQEMLANLKAICRECYPGRCDIEVVDVLAERRHMLSGSVLVTPILMRVSPSPLRLVVGNLSDRATIVRALDLPQGARNDTSDGDKAER